MNTIVIKRAKERIDGLSKKNLEEFQLLPIKLTFTKLFSNNHLSDNMDFEKAAYDRLNCEWTWRSLIMVDVLRRFVGRLYVYSSTSSKLVQQCRNELASLNCNLNVTLSDKDQPFMNHLRKGATFRSELEMTIFSQYFLTNQTVSGAVYLTALYLDSVADTGRQGSMKRS